MTTKEQYKFTNLEETKWLTRYTGTTEITYDQGS